MNKKTVRYSCANCSYISLQWMGKCPGCGEWNSFLEENHKIISRNNNLSEAPAAQKLNEIQIHGLKRFETGLNEFDRAIGGGIVEGSVTLITGDPGVGKSTLLLEVVSRLSTKHSNCNVLYITGEESSEQVAGRAKRMNINAVNLYIFNQNNYRLIEDQISKIKPKFIILDSVQTIYVEEIGSIPGTVQQIREVTFNIMERTKKDGLSTIVVGHITKEGSVAGPKLLEHMVDTVISFESDNLGQYRFMRATKNRFGRSNEVGVFEMKDNGLVEVGNPSQVFLLEGNKNSPGRSISCISEGSRSLFIETQALSIENKFASGKRMIQGPDINRMTTILAIIEKHLTIPIGSSDIYVNLTGGLKINSRDIDLSILASLISSINNKPLDLQTVYVGEVGLAGEVRPVSNLEIKARDMMRLNYKRVVTSDVNAKIISSKCGLEIVGLSTVKDLLCFIDKAA